VCLCKAALVFKELSFPRSKLYSARHIIKINSTFCLWHLRHLRKEFHKKSSDYDVYYNFRWKILSLVRVKRWNYCVFFCVKIFPERKCNILSDQSDGEKPRVFLRVFEYRKVINTYTLSHCKMYSLLYTTHEAGAFTKARYDDSRSLCEREQYYLRALASCSREYSWGKARSGHVPRDQCKTRVKPGRIVY